MTLNIGIPVTPLSAVKRYVIGSFRRQPGMAGRLAGVVMAYRGSNRLRNQWTVDLLDIRPGLTDVRVESLDPLSPMAVCIPGRRSSS